MEIYHERRYDFSEHGLEDGQDSDPYKRARAGARLGHERGVQQLNRILYRLVRSIR